MIDSHIHGVNPQLQDDRTFPGFLTSPRQGAEVLKTEMLRAGITQALAMGSSQISEDDPLGINGVLELTDHLPSLHVVGIADPRRISSSHMRQVERVLETGRVKALKAYLGYLPYGPDHLNYISYIHLAAKYHLPFIMHTGRSHSSRAKLAYTHPVAIDEVATDFPMVNFVMAHFGQPWFDTAAEVIRKNNNVWADLSGLFSNKEVALMHKAPDDFLETWAERIQFAYQMAEKPERFLFGSNWPHISIKLYRETLEKLIPKEHQKLFFAENARVLFKIYEDIPVP
ncbi:MAG: amidohydrolase [Trueperaceae bacterium]|nr:amidohydrolase [Trueperaceae bacterium]